MIRILICLLCIPITGCGSEEKLAALFPEDFQWGVAGAAHQIEGGNTQNNWYQFETLPAFDGKTHDPSGEAAQGYDRYEEDADLAEGLGVQIYRLSIEWSRVEPSRDTWDEDEWQHYRDVLEDLRAEDLEPMVTLHHFTDPIWVYDMTDIDCADGPSDENLCGWANSEVAVEFAEFAEEAAGRFGDLVDEWSTFNEPMVYLSAGYVIGNFPPGKQTLDAELVRDEVMPILRGMLDGHAAAYHAVRDADTDDADADGTDARVGFTNSFPWLEPARAGNDDDIEGTRIADALLNRGFADGAILGVIDGDLDGDPTEEHPEWAGTCDLLGVQYYSRIQIVGTPGILVGFLPCDPRLEDVLGLDPEDLGCPHVEEVDRTTNGLEVYPAGLRLTTEAAAERYPGVTLRITENGIATANGERRAQSIVKHLLEVQTILEDGVPLDGYIHWSLMDNFEWSDGYSQQFGLYSVDRETFERTETLGAEVFRRIAHANGIADSLVSRYDTQLVPE